MPRYRWSYSRRHCTRRDPHAQYCRLLSGSSGWTLCTFARRFAIRRTVVLRCCGGVGWGCWAVAGAAGHLLECIRRASLLAVLQALHAGRGQPHRLHPAVQVGGVCLCLVCVYMSICVSSHHCSWQLPQAILALLTHLPTASVLSGWVKTMRECSSTRDDTAPGRASKEKGVAKVSRG